MSNKPRKYCAAFPCNQIAVDGAYCPAHRPPAPPKETDPFYLSVRWRRFRGWYLKNHPLCERCEAEGRGPVPAQMVDHVLELKDGGERLSEDNAMALCWKCHGIKTAAAQNKRKNHQQSNGDNRMVKGEDTYFHG
jgi:5-methylcytosine-specific restriction protein A